MGCRERCLEAPEGPTAEDGPQRRGPLWGCRPSLRAVCECPQQPGCHTGVSHRWPWSSRAVPVAGSGSAWAQPSFPESGGGGQGERERGWDTSKATSGRSPAVQGLVAKVDTGAAPSRREQGGRLGPAGGHGVLAVQRSAPPAVVHSTRWADGLGRLRAAAAAASPRSRHSVSAPAKRPLRPRPGRRARGSQQRYCHLAAGRAPQLREGLPGRPPKLLTPRVWDGRRADPTGEGSLPGFGGGGHQCGPRSPTG